MSKIVLEVSLGEALDKLTILDIKCDKIKDERKIDCQKEYDLLYSELKDYVKEFSYHYRILKKINLTIWNLQDNIHKDTNLTATYGKVLTEKQSILTHYQFTSYLFKYGNTRGTEIM